ncbi:MAG TPA: hypothetical protein VFN55_10345 [Solirubrobacteraceae bacterium]|nr:hypothetical protein [Solirubrobacteraceae bacterium]
MTRRARRPAVTVLLAAALVLVLAAVSAARAAFGTPQRLLSDVGSVTVAATGGTLWVASQPAAGGSTELRALDAATGAVTAGRTLGPVTTDSVLYALGWLWVTAVDSKGQSPQLLRLDPHSLATLSTTALATRHGYVSVASAGASIWVGDGGELDQVTAIGGQIVRRVPLPGAADIEVATGPGGQSLLVSEDNGSGLAHVQRRDPRTGALLAASARFLGAFHPFLGGTIANRLWLSEATGLQGYVQQLDAGTLRPTSATLPPLGTTNGVRASVDDGILWITQNGGRPSVNYCADPVTGRRRVTLPAPVDRGRVVAEDAARIYYVTESFPGALMSLRIPRRCR